MEEKFYVGQKVVITGNTNGHFHKIGEVVELTSAQHLFTGENGEEYWNLKSNLWYFDSDDCVPVEGVSIDED